MWVRANRVLGIALPFVEDRAEGVERSANIHFIGGHVVDRFGRKNIGERIIESVFAVPKCNSKTVIPRIKAQTARRGMHRTRRPELEDPRTQQVAPKCNSKTKTPKESEHRLRAEGTTADGEIMMPKIRATNGLQIPRGKSIQES